MSRKILTVIGARPQFIKSAPVSREFKHAGIQEILVHTGQHYDYNMSQIFFNEMHIPTPDHNLEVGSGTHGWQTAQMLMQLEERIVEHNPDYVMVYGDTNSTLAGALAGVKLNVPVIHVEAGLRSFNRQMPEEHNRVLTDHCADLLLCPTQTAVDLLARESITKGVHLVGDTMYDALLMFAQVARERSNILATHALTPDDYLLVTVHRPYNTDEPDNMRAILSALSQANKTVVFPIHPRTRQRLPQTVAPNIRLIEPVGYLDMLTLAQNAHKILTDSGGLQKEAYFLGVPCVTLRPETEWVETLQDGWNVLVGADETRILQAIQTSAPQQAPQPLFGDGRAAQKIAKLLV